MIIKNNNKAVDVLKNQHVCWEGQKTSRRFYVKKTVSYGKWTTYKDPQTIPSISWEGGTTVNCKCWVERTNTVREGFVISPVTEKHYLIPSFSGIASDCRVNTTGNKEDGFTFTFGKRDNATSDRTYTDTAQYTDETGSYSITVTVTQTKRDKYVTKLDNASITTNLIPASGGNISSGTLTFRKTYNTGESENVTENVTFSTVSATTKGTTESGVTDVKTIAAGGTTQKQTIIDGVTLTHPSFTVKQAANAKTIKTPESKKTTSVILSVSPTTVYSSGGTVTFTLLRKYTLNKVVYLYTSGSTSGGGSDANQGPEAVNANLTYTITGITGVSSTKGTSYKIPASTSARTIKFKTTYDGITSNEVSVSLKLDGPNESKAFIYSNLKITEYSYAYATDNPKYHFPASGKTISATDCTLKGTYDWTYTSMENKTVTETVTWTFNDLTAAMYTFTPTSFTADSLGTTPKAADILYTNFTVDIKNLKHTYNGKLHDVKNASGKFLEASSKVTLTRLGNSGTQASNPTSTNLSVSVSPTSFDYKGGSATLTATLIKKFNVTWTSGATSTNPTNTDVTSSTKFTGVYYISGESSSHAFSFSRNNPIIPNILSSTKNRTYTFTGKYSTYSDTATASQTGNTTLFTVTFHKNNTYAKWSKTTGNESITKKFSKDTPYTELIPDETPTWTEGSNLKYVFLGNYSTTTTGNAVTSGSLLTGDINLYARWSTASTGYVKVSWDPNSGQLSPTSGGTSTSNAIYDYHNPGTIKCLPSDIGYKNTPSKTGNTFLGWYYNSTYYTKFPVSITLGTTPIQFNAMYTVTQKTVYWNSNGGTFSDGSTLKSEKKNYGDSISAYSSSPSKTADTTTTYKFKGWSLTTNGNVVTFPYTLTTTSATFNFYAIYTSSANKYTVTWSNTYKPDLLAVFTDNTYADKTTSVNYNTAYTSLTPPSTKSTAELKNSGNNVLTQYSIAHWYDNNDYKTLIEKSSKKVTGACTVYLKYEIVKHRLELYSGEAKFYNTQASSSITYYYELLLENTNTTINPPLAFIDIPAGKKFIGWSKKSVATVADIASSTIKTTFNISAPTTYYAIFATDTYTINWNNTNSNIAIWSDKTKGTKTSSAAYGTKYSALTAPATLANPIKNDNDTIRYTGAWYTASINGTLLSNSSATVTSNPTNVYLLLTIASYKVTLNPSGGTLTVSGEAYTSSSPYITYIKGSFNLGSFVPTHTNLNFKGWSTNSSATTGSTSSVTINAAITYYAIWKQLFTVTWNLNGGNIGGDTFNKTESVESGSTVSFTKYTPVKTNSSFLGWSDLSTAQTGSLSGNSPAIFANITYYAIWASYGTINLNPNGGTLTVSGTAYTSTYTFRYYQSSLTLSAFTPTRNGYTFVGWNENKDATTGETSFTLGTTNPTTIWTGTKTYYAIWKSAILTPILLVLA